MGYLESLKVFSQDGWILITTSTTVKDGSASPRSGSLLNLIGCGMLGQYKTLIRGGVFLQGKGRVTKIKLAH